MEVEIKTTQKWDENSLLAKYVELLISYKGFCTNAIDWQEAKADIENSVKYIKEEHGVEIIIKEDEKK